MGENVIFIEGDFSYNKNETCEIHLLYESESSARSFNIRQVSGKFSEDFVVSPKSKIYTVKLICGSSIIAQRVIRYPEQIERFNFGSVSNET